MDIGAPVKSHDVVRRMFVAGNWVESLSGQTIDVENPATQQLICRVPRGGAEDVNLAVKAALRAFAEWRRMPPKQRGHILLKIADALEQEAEAVARILAEETGNALRTQCRPEVRGAIDVFRHFGGLACELKGETVPLTGAMLNYTLREPLGVVGAVIPWNGPVALASLKIAPAICAGNTVVLKTAEDAPLGVLALAEICSRYLPAGVVNILTGFGPECGAPLMQHADVAKLTFTGSTETGKSVMRAAAERVAPVSLELGGKSPNIVFPDVDEDWVVDGAMAAARVYRQSQSCTAGSRLFVHERIYDSFLSKLKIKFEAIRIGDPLDERTDMGSLISKRQQDRVCSYIQHGLEKPGAELLTGGMPPRDGPLSTGYYSLPSIFTGLSNDWRLAREEIFGPVICAIPWKDEEDVVRMANDTHYGLAAYVWTRDIGKALRTAHAMDAGFVQVNQAAGQYPGQSYGGIKQSGIGREYSLEGMLESFTVRKTFCINVDTPPKND